MYPNFVSRIFVCLSQNQDFFKAPYYLKTTSLGAIFSTIDGEDDAILTCMKDTCQYIDVEILKDADQYDLTKKK